MLYVEIMEEKIEEKRQEMIQLAQNFGFTSELAVQASQELDSLLNALTSKNVVTYFSLKSLRN